jgi:hypothetical protein
MARLHARRRHARRRTRLARLDLLLGVLAALFVLIISPGLAITGIIALLVLLACGLSVVLEHRHAKGKPLFRRSRPRDRDPRPRGTPVRAVSERPRSAR